MGDQKVKLGSVEKLALGHGQCFVIEGKEIAVFRLRSGGFKAIGNRCPHRRAPLCDGLIDESQVVCPFHGHKFNLSSGAGSEAGESVKTYPIHEEGNEIFIEIE